MLIRRPVAPECLAAALPQSYVALGRTGAVTARASCQPVGLHAAQVPSKGVFSTKTGGLGEGDGMSDGGGEGDGDGDGDGEGEGEAAWPRAATASTSIASVLAAPHSGVLAHTCR